MGLFLSKPWRLEVKMPDIINVGDSEALVRAKITAILEFDGVSTDNILSWGTATNRLNTAATWLELPQIANGMIGSEARERINALALSPAPVFPENTEAPTISGNAQHGQTLSVGVGAWNGYPVPRITYQWKADGVDIEGATENQYTIGDISVGKAITVEEIAVNGRGVATAESNPTELVTSAPFNTIAPTISGTPSIGEILTINNGTWIAYPESVFTYQWYSDGVEISGATSVTYTTQNSDIGKEITASVTATNSEGFSSETTSGTQLISSAPILSVAPVLGEVIEGAVTTADNGAWFGYPLPTFTYQWRRNGVDIAGETNQTYTAVSADLTSEISVVVTATNEIGSSSEESNISIARPAWASGLDLWRNFVTDVGTLNNPTDNHSTNIVVPNEAGVYSTFAPNVLVRNDLGLHTVPTRTNGATNSSMIGAVSGSPGTAPNDWGSGFAVPGAGISRTSVETFSYLGLPAIRIRNGSTSTTATNAQFALMATSGANRFSVSPGQLVSVSAYLSVFEINGLQGANGGTSLRITWQNTSGSNIGQSDTRFDNTFGPNIGFLSANFNVPDGAAFAILFIRQGYTTDTSVDFTYEIVAPQIEIGTFASPPILTTGTSATVAGNSPVTTGLDFSQGVGGFVTVDVKGFDPAIIPTILGIETSTPVGQSLMQATYESAANLTTGLQTFVFAASEGYTKVRVVGQADTTSSNTSYSGGDRVVFGKEIYNIYKRVALRNGVVNDTIFNDIYAKALL